MVGTVTVRPGRTAFPAINADDTKTAVTARTAGAAGSGSFLPEIPQIKEGQLLDNVYSELPVRGVHIRRPSVPPGPQGQPTTGSGTPGAANHWLWAPRRLQSPQDRTFEADLLKKITVLKIILIFKRSFYFELHHTNVTSPL